MNRDSAFRDAMGRHEWRRYEGAGSAFTMKALLDQR